MKAVSARTMRDLDEATIADGTPGEVLMERAGAGAFDDILGFAETIDTRHIIQFVIVTGKGKNGGDGHVVARLVAEHTDYPVTVFSTCPKRDLKGAARRMADALPDSVRFLVGDELPDDLLIPGVLLIDALLGTGIAGEVRGPTASLIRQMNASGLPIVALDIPSGVNADDGSVAGDAIHADLTVTMGLPKTGLFMGEGLRRRGNLRLVDIGIPDAFVAQAMSPFDAIFAADVRPFLGRLDREAHKGSMGRTLIVATSRRYPGSGLLTGSGALRAGGGLVTLAYPASIASLLRPPHSALILFAAEDGGEGCHRPGDQALLDLAAAQDVLAIGPGLTRDAAALDLVRDLLRLDLPVVLDADGLAVVERHPDALRRAAITVLTPHPGELRRLLAAVQLDELADQDRLTQASRLAARLGTYVVLKGAATVVAAPDGRLAVNSSGSPGLATGGSGDVLTGILAAFLAQSDDPWLAIQAAVFLHGLAAELAPHGQRQLIADDLPVLLGEAMQLVSPFA